MKIKLNSDTTRKRIKTGVRAGSNPGDWSGPGDE
jgi:hypothetical protein